MKKLFDVTAVAICSSLFLQGAVAGEGKIKIGVLTDLSGPAADIGKGSVASAQIAVEEFDGKLLGKSVARDYGITPEQYPRAPIPLFSIT